VIGDAQRDLKLVVNYMLNLFFFFMTKRKLDYISEIQFQAFNEFEEE